MEHTSLHSYLQERFANKTIVSDIMIQQAKLEYRKMYLSWYNKKYRETYIQISFRIYKKRYQQYKVEAKKEDISVSKYLKNLVLNTPVAPETNQIKIVILRLIDIVEEAIHQNNSLNASEILSHLENLYDILHDSQSHQS